MCLPTICGCGHKADTVTDDVSCIVTHIARVRIQPLRHHLASVLLQLSLLNYKYVALQESQ